MKVPSPIPIASRYSTGSTAPVAMSRLLAPQFAFKPRAATTGNLPLNEAEWRVPASSDWPSGSPPSFTTTGSDATRFLVRFWRGRGRTPVSRRWKIRRAITNPTMLSTVR